MKRKSVFDIFITVLCLTNSRKGGKFNSVIAVLFISVSLVFAQNNNEERLFPSEELVEDFNFMLKTLEKAHPNLYAYISKDVFFKKADNVRKALKQSMTKKEFYLAIAPIVASICDGHTQVNFTEYWKYYDSGGMVFPFSIKWIDDHVYIRDIFLNNSSVAAGTEIISINNIPITNMLDSMYHYCPQERIKKNYSSLEWGFQSLIWLIYGWKKAFEVEYILPCEGKIRTKIFKGTTKKRINQAFKHIHIRDPYALNIFGDENIAVIRIVHFMMDDNEFTAFLDSSFKAINDRNIVNLIIDIRGNSGGKKRLALALLDYLTDKNYSMFSRIDTKSSKASKDCVEADELYVKLKSKDSTEVDYGLFKEVIEYFNIIMGNPDGTIISRLNREHKPKKTSSKFRGKVYVLIDNNTFSTATDLAVMVKDNHLGTIIGEETGGVPSGYGNPIYFKLPNTGLYVSCSNQHFIRPNGLDNRRGVIPDYEIGQTVLDLIYGTDRVLEYAKWLIARDEK